MPPEVYGTDRENLAKADADLVRVGLNVSLIKEFKRVLDLGAGDCVIERTATQAGGTNVTSVGLKPSNTNRSRAVNFTPMDITREVGRLPLASFDLIVSINGPMALSKTREQAVAMLENSIRLLSPNGELRIAPIRFGFIKQELFSRDERYANIQGKLSHLRTAKEIDYLQQVNQQADSLTQERLRNLGYVFEVGHGLNGIENSYLVFKKSQNPYVN